MSFLSGISERIEQSSIPVTETGCWLWTLAPDEKGYGLITIKGVTKKAHRVSYQAYKGEIPEGKVVMHSCDCRACVNPDHLRLGSQIENIKDRDKKGRMKRKLSDEAVLLIRASTENVKTLAKKFNVSEWTIYDIRNLKRGRFKNVTNNVL